MHVWDQFFLSQNGQFEAYILLKTLHHLSTDCTCSGKPIGKDNYQSSYFWIVCQYNQSCVEVCFFCSLIGKYQVSKLSRVSFAFFIFTHSYQHVFLWWGSRSNFTYVNESDKFWIWWVRKHWLVVYTHMETSTTKIGSLGAISETRKLFTTIFHFVNRKHRWNIAKTALNPISDDVSDVVV